MCDTMYAGPGACAAGQAWFAKNSDRNPEEPQAVRIVGRRPEAPSCAIGGRELPFPDRGLAFVLSKPSWMDGGEMGVNERAVAIGNEAVFSRFKAAPDGVLGMDILRAALSSCESAKAAVDAICAFTEARDQGGNGAYRGKLVYHNSYIVSDPREAYVLETAGRRWAWRPIESVAAISNAYSIEDDYKRLDAATRKEIAPVNERSACSDEADPGRIGHKESWRAHVEDRLRLRFTRGDERRAAVESALRAARGAVGLETVLGVLRSHGPFDPARPPRNHMASVCMHAGGFLSNASTASMALAYLPAEEEATGGTAEAPSTAGAQAVLWFTGTSYPCLSLYKPLLLRGGDFLPLWTGYDYAEGSGAAYDYWERQRAWIKEARAGASGLDPVFAKRRDEAQARLAAVAAKAAGGGSLEEARREVDGIVAEWEEGLEAYRRPSSRRS